MIKKFFFFLFFLFFSLNVFATVPTTHTYSISYNGQNFTGTDGNNVCSSLFTYLVSLGSGMGYSGPNRSMIFAPPTQCHFYYMGAYNSAFQLTTTNVCPAGSTVIDFNTCTNPPNPCIAGIQVSSGFYDGGKSPNGPFPNVTCDGTCSATFTGDFPFSTSMQADGLHYYAKGSFSKDGFQCSTNTSKAATSTTPLNTSQAETVAAQSAKKLAIEAAAKSKALADAAATKAAATAAASKAASDAAAADATKSQAQKDAAAATAAADATASTNANTTASDAAGTVAGLQMPDLSGLNQEGTQQGIASTLKNSDATLTDIKTALTGSIADDNSLTTQKTELDTAATAHGNAIKAIGDGGLDSHGVTWSWLPSVPSGTCSPYTYALGGQNHTLDYCPTIAKIRDIFGWILYITTAVGLFYIFTGKRED